MNPMLLGPTPVTKMPGLTDVPLTGDARALLSSAPTPADFLQLLIQKEHFADALCVFPFVVGIRQAVWWACLCCWHGVNRSPAPGEDAAFAALVRWLQAPTPQNHQAAVAIASNDAIATPVEHCTRAVAWAGFMKSAEGPWETVEPRAVAKTVAGCVFLSLAQAGQNGVPADEKQLLKLGLAVADGALAWDDEIPEGTAK